MDERILKRLAVKSIVLMLVVIPISTIAMYCDNGIFNSKSAEIVAQVTAAPYLWDMSLLKKEIEENDILYLSKIGGIEGSEAFKEVLMNRYIRINKNFENETEISLEDIYMERRIKIKIDGLKEKSLDYNSIARVKKEQIYTGKIKGIESEEKLEDKKDAFKGETSDFASNIVITYEENLETETYTAIVDMVLDTVYVHTIYENELHYYINLQKPKDVYDKLIVVDAGHGGDDIGTFTNSMKYVEKDLNLSIVHYLKKFLNNEEGIKVYYTRLKDEKPFLRPRVRLANDLKADFFISIHCNGSNIAQPHGTEVLYNEKSRKRGFNSEELAKICLEELTNAISFRNRGVISGSDKYIIREAKVPVALYEIGYITNENDLEFLKQAKNREQAAKGIYNGIMKAFKVIESEE